MFIDYRLPTLHRGLKFVSSNFHDNDRSSMQAWLYGTIVDIFDNAVGRDNRGQQPSRVTPSGVWRYPEADLMTVRVADGELQVAAAGWTTPVAPDDCGRYRRAGTRPPDAPAATPTLRCRRYCCICRTC